MTGGYVLVVLFSVASYMREAQNHINMQHFRTQAACEAAADFIRRERRGGVTATCIADQ